MNNLEKILANIPKQPQSQISLSEQLIQLQLVANKLGLYDAADFLATVPRKEMK